MGDPPRQTQQGTQMICASGAECSAQGAIGTMISQGDIGHMICTSGKNKKKNKKKINTKKTKKMICTSGAERSVQGDIGYERYDSVQGDIGFYSASNAGLVYRASSSRARAAAIRDCLQCMPTLVRASSEHASAVPRTPSKHGTQLPTVAQFPSYRFRGRRVLDPPRQTQQGTQMICASGAECSAQGAIGTMISQGDIGHMICPSGKNKKKKQ